MCNRISSQNMSLVGFGAIFVTLGSLIYLIHITHSTLEATRERLRSSEERLLTINKQFQALSSYTTRLEQAFINMKSERATVIQSDLTAREELDEERSLCTKKLTLLQTDLKACQEEVSLGCESMKQRFGNDGLPGAEAHEPAASNRHIRNYKYYLRQPDLKGDSGQLKPEQLISRDSLAGVVTSSDVNKQQHIVPGDPNEDLAGNVLI